MSRALRLNRIQTRSERQLTRELRALITRTTRKAAAQARKGHGPEALERTFQSSLKVVLTRAYLRAMLRSRDELFTFVGEAKAASDIFEEITQSWVKTHVAARVTTITANYFGFIRKVISQSFDDGLGPEDTARIIRKKVGKEYAQWGAARIARTEMAAATNKGSDAAARSTGLEMVKEWSSADDARTRPTHAAADGQVREMDEPFSVGDYSLMHPGDPSGPAGEVINCRCVVLYHPTVAGEILR